MFRTALVSIALLLSCAATAWSADFNGVWKGKVEFGGQQREFTYTLKVDKEKLTGSVESGNGKFEIADGKVSGDSLTFNITRNDNKIAYEGKLADGKMNIKVHLPNGDREYQLIRVVDIAGPWQTKIKIPDGAELELKYEFKVDGEKLTGSVESPAGQIDLREGKIAGDEISYRLTIGDRDVSYTGKIADGKINLKSRGGPLGDLEYLLTRVVNLAGAWEAKFTTQDGQELPLKFDLKIDGDKLTGTVEGPNGPVKIANGKINGDEISFDVDVDGNVIQHKGRVAKDEIKLKVNGFGAEWELTMKRPAVK